MYQDYTQTTLFGIMLQKSSIHLVMHNLTNGEADLLRCQLIDRRTPRVSFKIRDLVLKWVYLNARIRWRVVVTASSIRMVK